MSGDVYWVRRGLYLIESNKYKQYMDPEWFEQVPSWAPLNQIFPGDES